MRQALENYPFVKEPNPYMRVSTQKVIPLDKRQTEFLVRYSVGVNQVVQAADPEEEPPFAELVDDPDEPPFLPPQDWDPDEDD